MSRATIAAAAAYWDIPAEEVVGPGRTPVVVLARTAAAYVMRRRDGMSYPRIGQRIGGRDHSTAMNAVKVIAPRWLARDADFAVFVEAQMALPKYCRRVVVPARPREPGAVPAPRALPAPVPPVPAPTVPCVSGLGQPKPELQWQKIGTHTHTSLTIREDGMTLQDLRERAALKNGNARYLAALAREWPERFVA